MLVGISRLSEIKGRVVELPSLEPLEGVLTIEAFVLAVLQGLGKSYVSW